MSDLTLVLNLGLKSVRAVVFGASGERLAIAYRPIETHLGEGIVEQDPEDWWTHGLDVMDEVLADHAMASRVGRITVTASAGCLVALDADYRVVRPAIMISDVRSRHAAERIERLLADGGTTTRVTPDLMLPKITWMRDAEPELFGRTRWFATPNDFLTQRLTGMLVTDAANASKYFFEAELSAYPQTLLDALKLDTATLPPVVTGPDTILPLRADIRDRLGVAGDAVAVLSTYDAICAVYGSGVARIGDACDVSGTVTSFRAVTDRPVRDPEARLFITPHVRAKHYLAGGSNNLAGGVIEWAKQVLYPDDADPYAAMVAEVAAAPPGAAGLTFLPYLLGERAPVWDPTARAVFFGLGRNHARGDLIRAVFEGVGYSVMDIADRLAGMGVQVDHVSASGGLARLDPINQIKADMLGVPIHLTAELETTALGAALIAGVTTGLWSSIDEATERCVRRAAAFDPVLPRTRMYADFFGIYRQLYERVQPLFDARERLIAAHGEVLRTELARSEYL
jgi:sugar (pentulose or hexulose) kinase